MHTLKLWEILVPTHFNEGAKIDIEHHKRWDTYVQDITKGLTIQKTSKGIWLSRDEVKYEEAMIPVKIACTKVQIDSIADFTSKHYKQKAIFFYKVSEEVHIVNYNDQFKRSG